MGAVVIRRLEPGDWEAYRAIRLQALADAPDAFCATLAEALARPPSDWAARLQRAGLSGVDCPLGAEVDGELVGLAWAMVDADDAESVNLFQVWTAPRWRGKGVAGGLLNEAIAWSRSRGAKAMRLGVNCANPTAIGLYARAGFVAVGSPFVMREGTDLMEQQMRLEL